MGLGKGARCPLCSQVCKIEKEGNEVAAGDLARRFDGPTAAISKSFVALPTVTLTAHADEVIE
jgi:hypothetical protein